MNKHLLLTGVAMLFAFNLLSQHTLSPSASEAMAIPLPASSPVYKTGNTIQLDGLLTRADGLLTGLSVAGDTQFVSTYKKDYLHGNWKSWYPAKKLLDSGRLNKSVPDGEWKGWYPNGRLRFIRTYNASKLQIVHHEIRRRNSKATYYPITEIAKRDLPAARQLLTASYSFHAISNPGPLPAPTLLKQRVERNAGADGASYLPPFTSCLHHGLYMNFYPDGSVKDSGYYKNGVRDGVWEEWLQDGSIRSSGLYKKGARQDDWRHFSKNGKLLYIVSYHKGRATRTFYMN